MAAPLLSPWRVARSCWPRSAFLPIRWETHWADGSLLQSIVYEYDDVLDGKAKFLKTLIRRFYKEGVTLSPDSALWNQQIVRNVTVLSVNQPIPPSTFTIEFAPGTRVTDNTKGAVYRTAPLRSDAESSATIGSWNVIATVSLLVSLVIVRVVKR